MSGSPVSRITLAGAACAGTAAWVSLGELAVTDADSASRVGLLPQLWLLPVSIVAAVAIAAAVRLSSRVGAPLFLSLFVLVPWLPVPVPDALLVWTGPAVALLWIAIAMCLAVGAAPAWPAPRLAAVLRPAVAPGVAGTLAFAIFLGVWSGQRLPPTGDEPHYLLIAQSLLADGDVMIANNYEQRDYLPYYGGTLDPHFARSGAGGGRYSFHSPGVSAVVAPAFALGGYRGVVVWMAWLSALGTALVWKAGHALTGEAGAAWFGWAVVTLTIPGALYGSLVYPDSVAGVLFALCTLALVRASRAATDSASVWQSMALGTSVGVLPWLHTRLALPAVVFAALLSLHLVRGRGVGLRRWIPLSAFIAPLLVSAISWLAFFRATYGSINPVAPWADRVPLEVGRIAAGLLGLLADQESGLLGNAPVHLVSFAGLWAVTAKQRRLGLELMLSVVPYALAVAAWPAWWAGSCPPGRFLLPIVVCLGVGAAGAWARQGARARAFSLTLLGASVIVAAAHAFGGGGALSYNDLTGRARWLDWVSPLVDLPRALPSFFRAASAPGATSSAIAAEMAVPVVIWAVALAAGWMVSVGIERGVGARAAVRPLILPACLMVACSAATAAAWRESSDVRLTATRGQIALLRAGRTGWRSAGVQPYPAATMSAPDVLSRLVLSSSALDPLPLGARLFLTELPAGGYRLVVTERPNARGELAVRIGRATLPAARWRLGQGIVSFPILLPVTASSLAVVADADAAQSVERIVAVPDPGAGGAPESPLRARDAARYGSTVVYAVDDRVWLEPGGFWIMGERRPDVVFAVDQPVDHLDLDLRNAPVVNRIRLRSGAWTAERTLAADERWPVRVPVAGSARTVFVNIDVEKGVRPTHVDPASRDGRLLGCRIEVR